MFSAKSTPYRTCTQLSECLSLYEPHEVVKNRYIYEEFDKEMIDSHLEGLTLENCNIVFSSKKFESEATEIEEIYDSRYKKEEISHLIKDLFNSPKLDWVTCDSKIHLPAKNDLIPKDFTIHNLDQIIKEHPKLVIDTNELSLWHQ